jgi:predicted PurR-regulated permease PerM
MRLFGLRSWLVIGMAGVVAIAAWGLSAAASIVIPLILAIVLGIVFVPLVDMMERRRIPRAAGAGITMVLILVIAVGTGWIVWHSVATQFPVIQKQLTAAAASIQVWLATFDLPASFTTSVTTSVKQEAPKVGQAAANWVLQTISSTLALIFTAFLAFYMLFFTLADNALISRWIGSHIGLPAELGQDIVLDSFLSVRQYFKGTTVLAFITTAATILGLWAIHVPLVIAIGVVTFMLSYIPFFGAIVSGAFAVLIALGAGGPQLAVETLIVVLFAQNILQSVVQAWAIGSALSLHPLVVLIATTLGGIFGGLIGGMLGAPVAAMIVRATERIREASAEQGAAASPPAPVPAVDTT